MLQADSSTKLERPSGGHEISATVLRMVGSPNLADKSWVTQQYDRYVLGNTASAMPEDAGIVRLDESTVRGVALATDCNGRFTMLDPYAGAQLALSEAYRNVAATGAAPLAVTNCLNFGSPEDPHVMWQFSEAVRGLADACLQLGVPVTGGNVSFYNQTGETAILPTPVIGVLGVIDDVNKHLAHALTADDLTLVQLGTTRDEFDGSEWTHVVHGHLGGLPPRVDLEAERALAKVLVSAARNGAVVAAHDISDGGLVQTVVEMCLRGDRGARLRLDSDAFTALFSESVARAVVAVRTDQLAALIELATQAGVPTTVIGTSGGDALIVEADTDSFEIPVADLRAAHTATLPALFNH